MRLHKNMVNKKSQRLYTQRDSTCIYKQFQVKNKLTSIIFLLQG